MLASTAAKDAPALLRCLTQILQHTTSFSTASPSTASTSPVKLTPAHMQQVASALRQASAAVAPLHKLVMLTSLAGHYRDILVSQEALYAQQVMHQHPLHSSPLPSRPAAPADPSLCTTTFPITDVTELPDNHPSLQPPGQQLDPHYMDKITCWAQTQPSHVETSRLLQTGITLFPPQEASHPTFVDLQAAMKLLDKHRSRKRINRIAKLFKFQDKYQLRTWQHHVG